MVTADSSRPYLAFSTSCIFCSSSIRRCRSRSSSCLSISELVSSRSFRSSSSAETQTQPGYARAVPSQRGSEVPCMSHVPIPICALLGSGSPSGPSSGVHITEGTAKRGSPPTAGTRSRESKDKDFFTAPHGGAKLNPSIFSMGHLGRTPTDSTPPATLALGCHGRQRLCLVGLKPWRK